MIRLPFLAAALVSLAAGAQEDAEPQKVTIVAPRDAAWASYRQAYKATSHIAAFTRTRPLIQAHMQVRPNDNDYSMAGLKLQLSGETTSVEIPVDAVGRATVPLLKTAYDEDAVLRLNRRKGSYHFSGLYSIREREDGVYSSAELREACEQLLSAQRASGYRLRLLGKKCSGVKFVYARTDEGAAIAFTDAARSTPIVATEGPAFRNGVLGPFKVALYRFADWPEQGTVTAARRPLAILSAYD